MSEKSEKHNSPVLLSTEEVCSVFEITRRTLSNWERTGLGKHSRGYWDLRELLRYRGLSNASNMSGKDKSLAGRKLEAEVALKEAQGELARLKNDILDEKYLDTYFVVSELKRFFTVFKRSTLNLSRKVGGLVASHVEPEVARRMEKEIRDTMVDALEQMTIDGVYNAKS